MTDMTVVGADDRQNLRETIARIIWDKTLCSAEERLAVLEKIAVKSPLLFPRASACPSELKEVADFDQLPRLVRDKLARYAGLEEPPCFRF